MNNFLKSMLLIGCLGMTAACSGRHQSKQANINVVEVTNPKYGKWQDQAKPPITFTRTLTIGNRRNLNIPTFHDLMGPVADDSGNIYFINDKEGKIYSFTPDGKLRWKKGKRAKSPGSFTRRTD